MTDAIRSLVDHAHASGWTDAPTMAEAHGFARGLLRGRQVVLLSEVRPGCVSVGRLVDGRPCGTWEMTLRQARLVLR